MNKNIEELAELGAKKFLNGEGTLTDIKKELGLQNTVEMTQKLTDWGYYMRKGASAKSVIGLKKAEEEYIQNYNNNPSITKISKKYGISHKSLSDRIKSLGYEVINHQNKIKFDNTIFDTIDTEEKAYWLGFIFADGYVSGEKDGKNEYYFELSLKGSDKSHLDKFNKFMKHEDVNHVKINRAECFNTGVMCDRCRWGIRDRHLWEILNSYGCIPSKSLILEFPKLEIFKDKTLIKHFIRGYWDGDGCLSYSNKEHTIANISVLGTEKFLTEVKNNLPLKTDYKLTYNNDKNSITKVLQLQGKNAFKLAYYLYADSAIYLDRKYKKYLEYCRLYEESYILLQVKNGKIKIDNPVLSSEIKESEPV